MITASLAQVLSLMVACECGVKTPTPAAIKPLNRQTMFREDGTVTDIPTEISEAPPYVQGEMEI